MSSKNLVIVESPAKAKTIKKYLGKEWDVLASMGHIRDLPASKFGVDIKKDFKPQYEIIKGKKKLIEELKKQVKKYNKVRLATDEDREGEAIAWHLVNALKLPKTTPRITFHEITKEALQKAVKQPRTLDMNLVDAQQGRRILDRVVGYKISPILWQKIKRGLSAGRVQSVAVRLLVEREKEVANFKPSQTWTLEAFFEKQKVKFKAVLEKIKGKKVNISSAQKAKEILSKLGIKKFDSQQQQQILDPVKNLTKPAEILKSASPIDFKVVEIKTQYTKKWAPVPFITSSLQAEASRRFGRGVRQVMRVAQKLYENGFITYMRTDSPTLSAQALGAIKKYVIQNLGEEYYHWRNFKAKSSGAQEAHEAIRPTNVFKSAADLGLSWMEAKLYDLIRLRTIASQMADAKIKVTTYHLSPLVDMDQIWIAKGEVVDFPGWLKIYPSTEDQKETLPQLKKEQILPSKQIIASQKWSKPPARYTEATLVKKLESLGIWRPSTYAPIIATIQERWYVQKHDKYLVPTEIAFLVTDYLQKYFSDLMDYGFTAEMETKLDKIAQGKLTYLKMLKDFWWDFEKYLDKAQKGEKQLQYVGKKCPKCWGELVYKYGRYGKFIACENYPKCDYKRQTDEEKNYLEYLKQKYEWKPCPEWGTIVVKMGKFGPFLTSSEYPKVKRVASIPDPMQEALEEILKQKWMLQDPDSWEELVVKKSKRGYFLAAKNYPKVKVAKPIPKDILDEAKQRLRNE